MQKFHFKNSLFAVAVSSFCQFAYAEKEALLDEVVVSSSVTPDFQSLAFTQGRKASDVTIEGKVFKSRSATLGNALAGELGVHSNPFGGGASAPVIRGQDGVRIKLLQNGSDIVDMSNISPDHTVAADTLLAQQVDLVRGTSTLIYGMASPAGVVNIIDKRIPTYRPEKGYEGEVLSRFDTASKERVLNAGVTLSAGENFLIRAEGLTRKSDNYRVPEVYIGRKLNYLPDSHNKSNVGTFGASWIGSRGYLGASFSYRQDHYGIPGHNHAFDYCSGHLFDTSNLNAVVSGGDAPYLDAYPHLMTDKDVNEALHFHCGTDLNTGAHSHSNVYGHQYDISSAGPVIDMRSKRYDLRGEMKEPLPGVGKVKLSLTYADYYHDEKHDGKAHIKGYEVESIKKAKLHTAALMAGKPEAFYSNRGFNSRLEIYHKPTEHFNGLIGLQYQTQKSSARRLAANLNNDQNNLSGERKESERNPLVENTNKQLSLFALEQIIWKNFIFELGARWEKQSIPISYNKEKLRLNHRARQPDLSIYNENALSYSGTIMWDFHPDYRLSVTGSHNERMPAPMELYYHGKHLATNSFEYGNRDLKKERSNNAEVGLMHFSDKWDFKVSAYYQRFKNYIHNENLHREGNLFMRRYNQSQAKFHGFEGEIGYQMTEKHKISLFGDYVNGRLFGFKTFYGNKKYAEKCFINEWDEEECDYTQVGVEKIERPNRNAARVPPLRLGFRLKSQFNQNWSGSLEYTRMFAQKRVSINSVIKPITQEEAEKRREASGGLGYDGYYVEKVPEDVTKGYHLVNVAVNYQRKISDIEYSATLNINNLLNQKVYIHNSYLPYVPQMGRNFMLNLGISF
ncbi:hypothetical protein A6B40_07130 [Mannheimia varigena]|uniref:TonB-dependent receptor domain-containing protein n=1 Tax=Mannheimia varigena TaxID=85404 RepID=UPI00159D20A1|nr:TonB-dependent receptor [Mannheimia varigena]QLB17365.1 hypothetical protein A6B40_07130 [Mannheimia varigena]